MVYTSMENPDYGIVLSNCLDPEAEIDGANIVINDYMNGDTLKIINDGGVGVDQYEYDHNGTHYTFNLENKDNGVYLLSVSPDDGGQAPIGAFEAVLNKVKLVGSVSGERSLTFSLGKALGFQGEDHSVMHYYEYVPAPKINWFIAKDEAGQRSHFGRQGYLATITTAEENVFIAEKAQGKGWLGAIDIKREHEKEYPYRATNGTPEPADWRWVTGPEGLEDGGNGRKFYFGYTRNQNNPPEPEEPYGPVFDEDGKERFNNWYRTV